MEHRVGSRRTQHARSFPRQAVASMSAPTAPSASSRGGSVSDKPSPACPRDPWRARLVSDPVQTGGRHTELGPTGVMTPLGALADSGHAIDRGRSESRSFPGLPSRGDDRNRTGVDGFAGRCVATPPRRRGSKGSAAAAPGSAGRGPCHASPSGDSQQHAVSPRIVNERTVRAGRDLDPGRVDAREHVCQPARGRQRDLKRPQPN
jgi:hypothetical protein